MAEWVIDTSVVMAWINAEPDHEACEPYLAGAACAANTIAEIATKLADKGSDRAIIVENFLDFHFETHFMDEDDAIDIGLMRPLTRSAGLSLGDRSCLHLAKKLGLPAITTDRAWAEVADSVGVEVRVIR